MNCKPGDLVVIVRSHPDHARFIGRIVKVVDWYAAANEWDLDLRHNGRIVCAPDHFLRPIRDPGDDATDETLTWLPAPSRERETA